ncbi:MAG: ATP-dependent DNA helicase RecG [Candidatus Neomarinimicrobiota bacterium]|nr:ATP-dependent DNA helicase RecG [Candidatus Neomarinimicrobiota bacterium]
MTNFDIDDPITKLTQIGARRAEALSDYQINSLRELVFYFPRKHLDRTNVTLIKDVSRGHKFNIVGKVETLGENRTRYKKIFQVIITDGTGLLTLTWFNSIRFIKKLFKKGDTVAVHGKVEWYNGFVINHPEFDRLDHNDNPTNTGSIIPIYSLTNELRSAGIEQRIIRKIILQALDSVGSLKDMFNDSFIKVNNLYGLNESLKQIHYPKNIEKLNQAIYRLKFDEHFSLQIFMALVKKNIKNAKTKPLKDVGPYFKTIRDSLSFELTKAQKRVIQEIHSDMKKDACMNRLLQGDVGSGKTIVAILSAALAVGNNVQVAVMAPTEILASQHYESFQKELSKARITCCLLIGKMNKKDRKIIIDNIEVGTISVVIGTHAIIQDDVTFNHLGLVIIDEQHRFGVGQRNKLTKKGMNPHFLSMTATPIPRTLSITYMGDMDLSIIDELPMNRIPITTKIIDALRLPKVYSFIKQQIDLGQQCMIVYPLVKESEKNDIAAAVDMYEELNQNIFSDIEMGVIHGRMKSDEKKIIMEDFEKNKIRILVSTTVIEVGIDIPNATMMLIEHAERFGLTQLHQLRGRVGRGAEKSYCILVNRGNSEKSSTRLGIMEQINDGFKIADKDLILRGPGDYIGSQQSGFIKYKIADMITDGAIIRKARKLATDIIDKDPNLENHVLIKKRVMIDYRDRLNIIKLN